jgi:hypothetical protein
LILLLPDWLILRHLQISLIYFETVNGFSTQLPRIFHASTRLVSTPVPFLTLSWPEGSPVSHELA